MGYLLGLIGAIAFVVGVVALVSAATLHHRVVKTLSTTDTMPLVEGQRVMVWTPMLGHILMRVVHVKIDRWERQVNATLVDDRSYRESHPTAPVSMRPVWWPKSLMLNRSTDYKDDAA